MQYVYAILFKGAGTSSLNPNVTLFDQPRRQYWFRRQLVLFMYQRICMTCPLFEYDLQICIFEQTRISIFGSVCPTK